jgi:hypothetical protein
MQSRKILLATLIGPEQPGGVGRVLIQKQAVIARTQSVPGPVIAFSDMNGA